MKQYLVRKCHKCKNICKIIREDGKIIHLEGLQQAYIYSNYKKDQIEHIKSGKIVMCINEGKNPMFTCCTFMLVSKFKEIKP